MSVVNSTLARIIAAKRPYHPFTIKLGEGDEVTLYARKASYGEQANLSKIWDEKYTSIRKEYKDEDSDTAAIYSVLRQASKDKLAKFVAQASYADYRAEVAAQYDKPQTDPDVITEAESLVKQEALALGDHNSQEELLKLAMERRSHFYAASEANQAVSRALALTIIYDENKELLFKSEDEVLELPIDEVTALVEAASNATAKEETADPLM
jgi:hypothetical protein